MAWVVDRDAWRVCQTQRQSQLKRAASAGLWVRWFDSRGNAPVAAALIARALRANLLR